MKTLLCFGVLSLILASNVANVSGFMDYSSIGIFWMEQSADVILDRTGNSTQCSKDLRLLVNDLKLRKRWALEMIDSSGKLEPGIMRGNIRMSGDYDGCLAVNYNGTVNNTETAFVGKFCSATVHPNDELVEEMPMLGGLGTFLNMSKTGNKTGSSTVDNMIDKIKMEWSFCIPSSCNATELQLIWNYTEYYYSLRVHLHFDDTQCDYDHKIDVTAFDVFTYLFFLSILVIAAASTVYDIIRKKYYKDQSNSILYAFSFFTNGKKLFTVSENNEVLMKNLDGIRVISMCWVVLGHTFMFRMVMPSINELDIVDWSTAFSSMIVLGGTVSVDTFLLVSGLLVVYLFLHIESKMSVPSLMVKFYTHRLLRLTPSLLVVILLHTSVMKHFKHNPLYNEIDEMLIQPCYNNWWQTVLYVQNYLTPNNQCIGQSWYLAVDTQLYFLAPILLFGLKYKPKIVIFATFVISLISMAYIFYISMTIPLILSPLGLTMSKFMANYYQPTHTRMVPWLIGCIMGYFLYVTSTDKIVLTKKITITAWCLCLGVMAAVVFGEYAYINENDVISSSFYNTFARPAWAIAICWVIFACTHDYAGLINKFLSWRVFNVLVRFNYSMYLLHLFIMSVFFLKRRTPTYFDNLSVYHEYIGNLIMTFMMSIPWTLLFESPIIAIEKYSRQSSK